MLGKSDATPMIAVKDLDRAKQFYSDTLGLKTVDEWGGEGVTLKSGDTTLNVYRSEFAGTNQATALTFDGNSHTVNGTSTSSATRFHSRRSTASDVCSNQRSSEIITSTATASRSTQVKHCTAHHPPTRQAGRTK